MILFQDAFCLLYNTAEQTLALMHSPPVSYTMPFPTQAIVRVADAGV